MTKRAAGPVVLSVLLASGCVVQNGEDLVTLPGARTTPQVWSPRTTPPAPVTSTAPPTFTPPVAVTSTTLVPTSEPSSPAVVCDPPSTALLDWTAESIATNPGPVTASAIVFAATTKTGDWYVVAIDRAFVRDDGTLAGGHSRDLGLTDVVNRRGKNSKLIPLGGEVKGKLRITWENVSWDGATLAAGKRAVARAIACLDAAES